MMFTVLDRTLIAFAADKDSLSDVIAKKKGDKRADVKREMLTEIQRIDPKQTASIVIMPPAEMLANSPAANLTKITGGVTVTQGIKTDLLLTTKDGASARAVREDQRRAGTDQADGADLRRTATRRRTEADRPDHRGDRLVQGDRPAQRCGDQERHYQAADRQGEGWRRRDGQVVSRLQSRNVKGGRPTAARPSCFIATAYFPALPFGPIGGFGGFLILFLRSANAGESGFRVAFRSSAVTTQ